jgi:ribosomal subunit interface protein
MIEAAGDRARHRSTEIKKLRKLRKLKAPKKTEEDPGRPKTRRPSMPLRVSGKNISIGTSLQQRIADRVEEATAKYFRGGYSGHATVGRDGFGFRTECVLHLDSGALLEARGEAVDAYGSADEAATNIEKRLRRYKRRRKDNQARRGG